MMPIPRQATCFISSDGAPEAITANPRELRKKAIVSISKPVRRSEREISQVPHMITSSRPKAPRMVKL